MARSDLGNSGPGIQLTASRGARSLQCLESGVKPNAILEQGKGITLFFSMKPQYIEEPVKLVPLHPITLRTAYLAGQIEGQEAAKETSCHSVTC